MTTSEICRRGDMPARTLAHIMTRTVFVPGHIPDKEHRDGPRNVCLLAIQPPDWWRAQTLSSKCRFTRHSTIRLMTSTDIVLEMSVYSPFNHPTDDEHRHGPRSVGLLAIKPPDWWRAQTWSSKCRFTRHSTTRLMTSTDMVLEVSVYSPFNHPTDDEHRHGPRSVGLLAIQPPDWWRAQTLSSKCRFTRHSTTRLMTSTDIVLEMSVYSPFNHPTDDEHRHCPRSVGLLAIQPSYAAASPRIFYCIQFPWRL